MKTLKYLMMIVAMLMCCEAAAAQNPVVKYYPAWTGQGIGRVINWFNETGTQVLGTTAYATTNMDSIVSEAIETADYDSFSVSFSFVDGDSVSYYIYLQRGSPDSAASQGVYTRGWGGATMNTYFSGILLDSVVTSSADHAGMSVGTGRGFTIKPWAVNGSPYFRLYLLPNVTAGVAAIVHGTQGHERTFLRDVKFAKWKTAR